jgi:hypothetical protein
MRKQAVAACVAVSLLACGYPTRAKADLLDWSLRVIGEWAFQRTLDRLAGSSNGTAEAATIHRGQVVYATRLNIRGCESATCAKVHPDEDALFAGEIVDILGPARAGSTDTGVTWLKIRSNNRGRSDIGWVNGDFIKLVH